MPSSLAVSEKLFLALHAGALQTLQGLIEIVARHKGAVVLGLSSRAVYINVRRSTLSCSRPESLHCNACIGRTTEHLLGRVMGNT